MFRRTPRSSRVADRSSRDTACDETRLCAEHLLEWREAAKRAGRAYDAWCAAGRRDRTRSYISFVDALRHEERAARELERDVSAVAPIPSPGGVAG